MQILSLPLLLEKMVWHWNRITRVWGQIRNPNGYRWVKYWNLRSHFCDPRLCVQNKDFCSSEFHQSQERYIGRKEMLAASCSHQWTINRNNHLWRNMLEPHSPSLCVQLAWSHSCFLCFASICSAQNNFNQYLPANHHIGGFDTWMHRWGVRNWGQPIH